MREADILDAYDAVQKVHERLSGSGEQTDRSAKRDLDEVFEFLMCQCGYTRALNDTWHKNGISFTCHVSCLPEMTLGENVWRYPMEVILYYNSIVGEGFSRTLPICTLTEGETYNREEVTRALLRKSEELKGLVGVMYAVAVDNAPGKWVQVGTWDVCSFIRNPYIHMTTDGRLLVRKGQVEKYREAM